MLSNTNDRRARERLSEAVHLWMQMREPEKAARASLLMGDSYARMKRFQESLDYYKQALEVTPVSNLAKAIAFNSIARIYTELYQFVFAKSYYGKAINHARIAKDPSAHAEALIGLAVLAHQSRELKLARAYIEQAQRLSSQSDNTDMDAALLHLTGRLALEQGLTDDAGRALAASLAIYERTGNVGEQTRVLSSISEVCRATGNNQEALDRARQAVSLADAQARRATGSAGKYKAWDWRWRAWFAQARALRALGQTEAAGQSYFRAVNYMEAYWLSTMTVTTVGGMTYGEERRALYGEYADLLIEGGMVREGYHVNEQAKARALIGLIEARRTEVRAITSNPNGLLGELARSIAGLRTQLLSSQISPKQRARIEREIDESEIAFQEAQAKAEMEHSGPRMAFFRPVAVEQLQKQLSPDKEYVLEFFLGERRSFAWLITSNDVALEILPGRQEIEKAVEPYLAAVNTKPNNLYLARRLATLQELAEKLCERLFGQLAERLAPRTRLIVVPDGILHYLPFETLRHHGRYLVEDHDMSYVASASMLGLLRNPKSRAEAGDRLDLLAFGDPLFSPQGSKQKRSGGEIASRQGLNATDGFHLDALPRTRDEVEEIAKLFPPDRRRVFLGKEATEDALKGAPLRRYRRLHIATHALVNERNPSRSAIVLTLDADPQEDGFLEVGEIAELDLDCDLVVLSACQTGRGELLSGEGIVGLSRAFLYAGARSVVVSLWNVSDISTSEFMKAFYQHLVSSMGNTEALCEAKLTMLRSDTEIRHPYYWAPFIVVGKP
jgi:CHAT domain-containing protein